MRRCAVVGVDDRSRGEWQVGEIEDSLAGSQELFGVRSLQELC